jgi:O-antigen/teichoic acid export membrane protein
MRSPRGTETAGGLAARSLTALKWNYAGIGTKVLAQLVVGVVLARLLGPEPFGVYSAVLLVIGVGVPIVERGFGSAVIQARHLNDEMIRYAFTRLLITGLAVAMVLCVAARSVAVLFRYPALTTAIYGSALYLFVYAISVLPGALLQRDLDMKSFQIAQIAAYLVGYGLVGISGAFLGLGAWSLITALVTQLIVYAFIAYTRVRHTIRPLFKLKNQQLTSFGNLVVATNLLNWAIENLDNLLVGRLYGMRSLGLYAVSYNLVRTPTNHVMTTAQGVLFPAGARAQENIPGLQRAYLTALSAVLLVLCPVFLGIASVAHTVVQGIYAGKWAGAEVLLLPLALAMPVHASMTGSALLWARGQVATELKVQAGTVVIFLIALLLASRISVEAIAWAVFAVYILRAWWLTSKVLHSLQLSWRAFLGAARGGLLLGSVTAGTFYVVDSGLAFGGMNSLNRLCILAGVGLVIVTVLPVCLRGVIASKELRALLERATPRSPGLLRTVMQLYGRA